MSKTIILITGANGNTGKATAQHLLKRADRDHYVIRVGARSADKVADLVKYGAEYVHVDFSDKDSLREALKGVSRVWAIPPNPTMQQKEGERVQLFNNLVDAAKKAGVKHFVAGSTLGAANESTLFQREFRVGEKHLETSSIPYTILRLTAFQENYLMYKETLSKGFFAEPIGRGSLCPISVDDIGLAAAEVLLNPHPHANKAYELTGPKALTGTQIAHRLSKVIGTAVQYMDADPQQTLAFLSNFVPQYQAKAMLELYNQMATNAISKPSPDFEKITGRTGTRFYNRMKQMKAWGVL
eukprot:TRINITY_DN14987_c0_g1_i1.p1 TRINITY_DN14987_c0_g1~~TRINITY_DN14987_c0_g1_i1.p1  ORF type:complete len:298 (-),score=56.59 TRINITY_DN14987_c0_g1_i1:64-957(-)